MDQEISDHITRIEMLYTEQEYTIQALNQITTRQDQEINRLRDELQLLKDQYRELKSSQPQPVTGNEKPPHY